MACALALAFGGHTAHAVENAVQAVGASPGQLSAYTVNGQVIDGTGIRIADLDTQIDPDHPALAGRIVSHTDYSGEGLLDPDTEFFAFNSINGQRVWLNDLHATAVAGVMVSNGLDSDGSQTPHVGISPGATLDVAKFWQHDLIKNTDGAIQAGLDLTAGPASILLVEDQSANAFARGDSSYTTMLDYLAYARDTLVVIPAGNAGPDNPVFSIPADAYNGLTVGATDETFSKVADFSNRGPTNDDGIGRAKPDLLAPGAGIVTSFGGWEDNDGRDGSAAVNYRGPGAAEVSQFLAPNITAQDDIDPDWVTVAGTSFSGPVVAGAGALLQQWGAYRGMDTSNETLRAVMVNSTNKVDGLLGMTRTIVDRQDQDWLASEAYLAQDVPLDDQMGAGQLDVSRALRQYDAGEQGPGAVDNIGWDKQPATVEGEFFDYLLGEALQAGDFISATLAWDRQTLFLDNGITGIYEPGTDGLAGLPLDNLDLYLMLIDDTLTEQALWSSASTVDNLEHLFWQVPAAGDYKLRVVFTQDVTLLPGFEATPDYTLAWWAGVSEVPEPASGAVMLMMLGLAARRPRHGGVSFMPGTRRADDKGVDKAPCLSVY
jgi:Subtilase family